MRLQKRQWSFPQELGKPGGRGRGLLGPSAVTQHSSSRKPPARCRTLRGGNTGASGWQSPSHAVTSAHSPPVKAEWPQSRKLSQTLCAILQLSSYLVHETITGHDHQGIPVAQFLRTHQLPGMVLPFWGEDLMLSELAFCQKMLPSPPGDSTHR